MPKQSVGLSDKDVQNAKPRSKPYKLYDKDGLCLLIRKTGTKVWQYHYQYKNKRKTHTIGQYLGKRIPGHISLKEARMEKHAARALLDQGIDPSAHKRERINGKRGDEEKTFEALGREWHSKGTWVLKHSKNILKSLEDDIFPIIGSKQITDVTRQDIIAVLSKVEEREAFDVAKRICQRCEAIFDYAIIKGVCGDNPAVGRSKYIQKPKSKPRPHFKENQLPEFLNKLDEYHGREYIRMALELLVLTFLRPGELRNVRWDDIDEKEKALIVPAERMKMDRDHSVPLSRQALGLLKELKKVTGNNPLLFPSVKNNQKPISDVTLTKVLRVLKCKAKDGRNVVPHGFRHTASTILNEHGFNSDHIERQLAHVDKNKVRGVYNHAEYMPDRRKMMQWWADHLDALKQNQ